MYKNLSAVGVVALALGVGAFLLWAAALPAKSPIEWAPAKVAETLIAGQEKTVEVSFTPKRDLGPVEFRVVPELASLLAISPASLPDAKVGEPIEVLLTFTPSPDSENGVTLDGAVQVRGQKGQTLARPLPVELTIVWETVVDPITGISLLIPPGSTALPKGDQLAIGPLSEAGLPPLFTVFPFTVPEEIKNLPIQDALDELALLQLELEDIELRQYHSGGLEISGTTFPGHHFFIYDLISGQAIEFISHKPDFFHSLEFQVILDSVEF